VHRSLLFFRILVCSGLYTLLKQKQNYNLGIDSKVEEGVRALSKKRAKYPAFQQAYFLEGSAFT
jgi:hypothetical protein